MEYSEILRTTLFSMRYLGMPVAIQHDKCVITASLLVYALIVNLWLMIMEEIAHILSRMNGEHFLEIVALVSCSFVGILNLGKAISLCANRKKIASVMYDLKIQFDELTAEEIKEGKIKKYYSFVINLSKYTFVLNSIMVAIYLVLPLFFTVIESTRNGTATFIMAFEVLTPFEVDNWFKYFILWFQALFAALTSMFSQVASDTMFFVFTTHICVKFIKLCNQFSSLDRNTFGSLSTLVKKHQDLIKITEEIENIFSPIFLLNYMISSIEICLLGFNIVAGDKKYLTSFFILLSCVLAQIYFLSMFGNLIIIESIEIRNAAYNSLWYETDKSARLTILNLQERSKKSQIFTAYKFNIISYQSFAKILSSSWSYFTLLNTMYDPSKIN